MLTDAGIDFPKHAQKGIPFHAFAEYMMTSGLVLNPDIHWVCFHGDFDFGYILKSITN